ncbi:STAS domain-containing protein [Streptomyces sp. NPDC096046]|uniref:STAS domain-containing protein n=1 Tax=Streptomyces sp. NPDC096046 TaxID=3155542 RepID=UPI003323667F
MAEGDMTNPEPAERSDQLSVVSTTMEGIRVLALTGEIDHHTGNRFQQALYFSDAACHRVVVDMSGVTFMDSTGINILITAHRMLSEAGGWLRLIAASESVKRTMHIVGIDTILDCRETLHEALSA